MFETAESAQKALFCSRLCLKVHRANRVCGGKEAEGEAGEADDEAEEMEDDDEDEGEGEGAGRGRRGDGARGHMWARRPRR